jgi:plasmid maintenance system antidote protein VapI
MINIPKLRGKIVENEMSISDLAEKMGISKSALYQKINNSVSFTIDEVATISKVLNLSKDEFNNIFFADFVA